MITINRTWLMNLTVELLQLYRCKHLRDLLHRTGRLFLRADYKHLSFDWMPVPGTVLAMNENYSPVWDNFENDLGQDAQAVRQDIRDTWTTAFQTQTEQIRDFLQWQVDQTDMVLLSQRTSSPFEAQCGIISNYSRPGWSEILSFAVSRERDRVLMLTARTQSPLDPRRLEAANMIFDTFMVAYRYLRSQLPMNGAEPDHEALNNPLSTREIECLQWLAVGKTISEAACILGISERTLRFHVTNARDRLGVSTTMQAVVAAALRYGFDPNDPRKSVYTACRAPLKSFA